MKHLVFLINPHSGTDRKKQLVHHLEHTLDKTVFSYEIQYTQQEKHGIELAQKAAENGAYGVIAVGGDGSVNDVLNGLKNTNAVLGIIPKGSGNGMARTLKIPLSVEKALQVINQNKVANVDVAYANELPFLSNAGVGFDAFVIEKFRNNKRRGFISYCSIINRSIWRFRPQEYHLKIDGKEWTGKAFMVNVANGKELGYGFQIAPIADWQDGLLELTVIKKFPTLNAVALAIRMFNRTLPKSRFVQTFRAKEIMISTKNLHLLQTDGDSHTAQSPIHFSIKSAQKIFVP